MTAKRAHCDKPPALSWTLPEDSTNRHNQALHAHHTERHIILRLAAWLDFASTPKGADISTYGIEGETFKYDENGYARSTKEQADAYLTKSTIYTGPGYQTCYCKGWLLDNNKLTDLELSEKIADLPYFHQIAYAYDADQQTRMATLNTQISSVRDEWVSKFIMGAADPADDAQWETYLANLEAAGLSEALDINTDTAIVAE